MRIVCWLAACCLLFSAGCSDIGGGAAEPLPKTMNVRTERIAYSGAPPVNPHKPQTGKCVTCHSATGTVVPGLGVAPANPHTKTAGLSADARCKQCHVFKESDTLFAENDFVGLLPRPLRDKSLPVTDPPTVPHPLFMREDCAACHTTKGARPEVVCTHPERVRCQQCHIPDRSLDQQEFQTTSTPLVGAR